MTPTEVNDIIDNWPMNQEYSLKYHEYTLYGPEYIVVLRKSEELFEVLLSKSSISLFDSFTKDELEKLFGSDAMSIHNKSSYQISYKFYKSNGCCCGAYILGPKYPHSDWCDKYVKPRI